MKKFGIDISRWQGDFDMARAKNEGVEFVIIKGGGGDSGLYVDKKFTENYENAKRLALPVGCYWFSKALSIADARKEAEYFLSSCLRGRKFELPIYMDVENKQMLALGKRALTDIVKTFLDVLWDAGYYAGIYSSKSMFGSYLFDNELSDYPHWVAQWATSCTYAGQYGMWQFGGEINKLRANTVAGVVCDQDYMLEDYPAMIKAAGRNGFTKTGVRKTGTIKELVALAEKEVGYLEKRSNSQLDDKTANAGDKNFTKYQRDMDAITGFYNGKKQGYSWCFTRDTLILTDNGYKPVQDISVGDKVLNAHGDKFNNVIWVNSHEADVVDVRVYGALPFSVTPDHKFLSQKRNSKWHRKKGFNSWGFNEIADLCVGDVISIPRTPVLYENSLSYDEIWTLGYYVGDGYCSGDTFIICANQSKAEEVEQHIDGRREKEYKSRTCIQYALHKSGHEELVSALRDCGIGAAHKRIPKCILFGDNETKRVFLAGYMAADGSKNAFNSISEELVTGLSRIIFDLNLGCSINVQNRPSQGKIFDKRINAYRTFNQKDRIYNCSINYNEESMRQPFVLNGESTLVPIKYKDGNTYEGIVYTISTDGDHTYTANNLGVHNCDVFCDWLFVQTFGVEEAMRLLCQPQKSMGAGCDWSAKYYKAKNQWYTTPQVGDQIFFKSASYSFAHTGLVVGVDANYVYTVEGNTSGASEVVANGGGVCKKRYPRNYANIVGYGRPLWTAAQKVGMPSSPAAAATVKTVSMAVRQLSNGMQGNDVKTLQILLNAYKCDCGTADGDFGAKTEAGLKKFQTQFKLGADGIAGAKTWGKLLNA